MKKKLPVEQTKSDILKALRTAIRLKHSLDADRELNEVLPTIEKNFDDAAQKGRVFVFRLSDWVEV